MAKSLDDLINTILENVAINGRKGATFDDIVSYVKDFYNELETLAGNGREGSEPGGITQSRFNVDKPFISRLWTWLAEHPDISIGENHVYDSLSLDEIDSKYPDYAQIEDGEQQETSRPTPQTKLNGPRVFVDEQRMYMAICGHAPDVTRVFPSEFPLLCAIASTREFGILQGDLCRATGQDKRSVPKRTDALRDKGYIVKTNVWTGGHKTSRLFLRRFAPDPAQRLPEVDSESSSYSPRVKDLAITMFSLLRSASMVTQDDLNKQLGMQEPGQIDLVSRIVRHFARAGCLKKLKTAFGPAAQAKDLKPCVQLLKEPTDNDWITDENARFDFEVPISELVIGSEALSQDAGDGTLAGNLDEKAYSSSMREIPQWNPDRLLPNVLFDAAKIAGADGLNNFSARSQITGLFVRRTIEAMLVRLSHRSLLSQPSDVRHLTLVRTQEYREGSLIYVHRVFDSYRKLVEEGQAKWSDLPGGETVAKELANHLKADLTSAVVRAGYDKFGFPNTSIPELQFRKGQAELGDLVMAGQAPNLTVKAGEPILQRSVSSTLRIATQDDKPNKVQKSTIREAHTKQNERGKRTRRAYVPKNQPDVVIGRPRKFLKGTEKFWRDMFLTVKLQVEPNYLAKYGKAGLMVDPTGLEMYNSRPLDFDKTLLQVIEADLPVPAIPQDVAQNWIDNIQNVLQRSSAGLYITPSGRPHDTRKKKSKIMILRTRRLGELDLFDRDHAPAVVFNVSSVSHSFRVIRYYPRLGMTSPSMVASILLSEEESQYSKQPNVRGIPETQDQDENMNHSLINSTTGHGPSRGTFFDQLHDTHATLLSRNEDQVGRTSPALSIGASTDATASDPELPNRLASAQQDKEAHSTKPVNTDLNGLAESATSTRRSTRHRRATQKGMDSQILPSLERRPSSASIASSTRKTAKQAKKKGQMNDKIADGDLFPQKTVSASPSHQNSPGLTSLNNIDALQETELSIQPMTHSEIAIVEETNNPNFDHDSLSGVSPMPVAESNENSMREEAVESVLETIPDTFMSIEPNTNGATATGSMPPTPNMSRSQRSSVAARVQSTAEDKDEGQMRGPKFKKGRDAMNQYRRFVMELVHMCSGVAPNDSSMFKRAMKAKCMEINVDSDPNAKLIKQAVKSLCDRGKLKTMYFSFNRGGVMVTKAVVVLPEVTGLDIRFQEIQEKIKSMPPDEDYFPPELWTESLRKPAIVPLRNTSTSPEPEPPVKTPRRPTRSVGIRKQRRNSTASTEESPHSGVAEYYGFVTFKVPRLKEITSETSFSTHYYALPPPVIHVSGDRVSTEQISARLPSRRNSDTRLVSENRARTKRKIRWTRTRFPKSLEDILAQDHRDHGAEIALANNPALARFEADIDFLASWEQRVFDQLSDQEAASWTFINHKISATELKELSFDSNLSFRLIQYDQNEQEVEIPVPEAVSWKPFVEALTMPIGKGQRPRQNKRKVSVSVDEESDLSASRIKRKKRPRRKRRQPDDLSDVEVEEVTKTVPKLRRNRGPRVLANMSEELRAQICLTVVCVQTLAGGLEGFIDWAIVERLLPNHTEKDIHQLWNAVSKRFLGDVNALIENLQSKYLTALKNGEVPSVNFEDLQATNWEGILKWAESKIDTSRMHGFSGLPASRADFLATNKVSVEERKGTRELYNHSMVFTQPMRETAFANTLFGAIMSTDSRTPHNGLKFDPIQETKDIDLDLARARSWVFATIITPKENFDSDRAHQKLLKLAPSPQECESMAETTIKALHSDKIIIKQSKKDIHGLDAHDWKVTQRFFDQFESRRAINVSMLKAAARYKLDVLDTSFSQAQPIEYPKNIAIDDGYMVAIVNLMSLDMVLIAPGKDVPASRYGLDWKTQGYKTKAMDKDVISFSVVAEAKPTYQFGDPLDSSRQRVRIPRGEMDHQDGRGRIPAWFDINNEFRPGLWEMFLSAVVGLVSVRPGASAVEITKSLSPCLSLEDVKLLVSFLEDCGVAKKTISGWETIEWWWMIIGRGHENGSTWNV